MDTFPGLSQDAHEINSGPSGSSGGPEATICLVPSLKPVAHVQQHAEDYLREEDVT
jgi:hypothetical protein